MNETVIFDWSKILSNPSIFNKHMKHGKCFEYTVHKMSHSQNWFVASKLSIFSSNKLFPCTYKIQSLYYYFISHHCHFLIYTYVCSFWTLEHPFSNDRICELAYIVSHERNETNEIINVIMSNHLRSSNSFKFADDEPETKK